MACCGQGKKKGFRTNGKICPKCGWLMNRVHKYNSTERQLEKYWICSNRSLRNGLSCGYKENIK